MDPTLKRRLIGGAILIVIAAIVLPMFLAGPPPDQPDRQTLPLEIPPAPDRDLSQVTLPIDGDAADPERIVSIDTGDADVSGSPAPEPAATALATGPATAVMDDESSEVPQSPDATAAVVPSTSTDSGAAAPSASEAPPTAATGRFWVGLGSYGQSANADRVVDAARARGIAIEREAVSSSGRDLIRLRAGPYATRAQAEQTRQLLIAAIPDAKPKIEESGALPTADEPAAAASAGAGAWAVQVGAFSQESNAKQLSDRLKGAGFPAFVERRGESYAVRVGPYVRRTDAEAQRQKLKSGQKLDGLIVSHSG